ncbi:hypothetical protein FKW77_002132 [Venturia effusa]|uniref:Uncharacterized protein n=1 Tax=Venturia effusa TaxID=50376 RepID=A0A517KZ61_9PEZI|nr:hypothetical protein FKW77_002132 [Venturia effusa]
MRFSAVFTLGLAAFVMATPVPEAEAGVAEIEDKRSVASDLAAALPHPIEGANKVMTAVAPGNLVARQANTNETANAASSAATAKKGKKGKKAKKNAANGNAATSSANSNAANGNAANGNATNSNAAAPAKRAKKTKKTKKAKKANRMRKVRKA